MTRILINCALAELRRNRRYAEEPEWESEEWAQEEAPVSAEEKMDLYRAIDHLDYPYKVIIIQKYFFDCKLNDIAELLEIAVGNG